MFHTLLSLHGLREWRPLLRANLYNHCTAPVSLEALWQGGLGVGVVVVERRARSRTGFDLRGERLGDVPAVQQCG